MSLHDCRAPPLPCRSLIRTARQPKSVNFRSVYNAISTGLDSKRSCDTASGRSRRLAVTTWSMPTPSYTGPLSITKAIVDPQRRSADACRTDGDQFDAYSPRRRQNRWAAERYDKSEHGRCVVSASLFSKKGFFGHGNTIIKLTSVPYLPAIVQARG